MNSIIMNGIYLLNQAFVGIFGMVLSTAFCDILWTRAKRRFLIGSMAVLLLFQGCVYFFIDPSGVKYLYPLITHLPLAIVLYFLSKKRLWPVISVLTAYLCCQVRRWLALLITTVLCGDDIMQNIAEILITLPLLFVLLRFAAPSVRSIMHLPISVQYQFGLIPAIYYGFDYLTQTYTNLLLEGSLLAVEFMPFVCCVVYLVFTLHISAAERVRSQLEQTQHNLSLQVAQAVRQIENLRKSQQKASAYRHDLRHHMQYLLACIENERLEQAQSYIREICSEIEANKVVPFCENEAANLIFSAFVGRAEEQGIPLKVKAALSQSTAISENDLCVLLSNALENALNACQKRKDKGLSGNIDVSAYEKKGKVFLQILNSCDENITFVKGIPVADELGHGIGVRSICAIVEKYGGIYSFSVKEGQFILRISL